MEPLKGKEHRIKFSLIIDENECPFLYQEPFIIPDIKSLPKKLTSKSDLNFPFIGFFDNSSVICIRNENGYDFLKSWNGELPTEFDDIRNSLVTSLGIRGQDLFLNFKNDKPELVPDMNQVKERDSFVVYGIYSICGKFVFNLNNFRFNQASFNAS